MRPAPSFLLKVNGTSQFSVFMLSLEAGNVGAGTVLEAQGLMLELSGGRDPGVRVLDSMLGSESALERPGS